MMLGLPRQEDALQPERPVKKPRSVMWKVLMIGILVLVLLIPLAMIQGIISERQFTKEGVNEEIAQTWAGRQQLAGPILVLPYLETAVVENESGKKVQVKTKKNAYLLPQQYQVNGKLDSEVRYRQIYQSIVYGSDIRIEGNFDTNTLSDLKVPKDAVIWNDAYVATGISSMQGLSKRPELLWQGKSLEMLPGVKGASFLDTGLYSPVSITASQNNIPFRLKLSLKGTQGFSVVPVGKQNEIRLNADWGSPSFTGSALPSKRKVSSGAFTAGWDIPYFARNYGQILNTDTLANNSQFKAQFQNSAIGVQLLTPVDAYRQSDRAIKYGILFLVLTFATYFICEVITRHRVHPFQYLLVGLALSLFYLLLIALSEVIAFGIAYAVSSVAIVLTITLYSGAILGKVRSCARFVVGGLLSALYGYLYILLQLEDLSLVFGAVGLLLVLSTVMYITRNIDWYNEQAA